VGQAGQIFYQYVNWLRSPRAYGDVRKGQMVAARGLGITPWGMENGSGHYAIRQDCPRTWSKRTEQPCE